MIAPYGKQFLIVIKLHFDCTNNILEYEACVSNLQITIEMRIKRLDVYRDSMLIIYQVKGE